MKTSEFEIMCSSKLNKKLMIKNGLTYSEALRNFIVR